MLEKLKGNFRWRQIARFLGRTVRQRESQLLVTDTCDSVNDSYYKDMSCLF